MHMPGMHLLKMVYCIWVWIQNKIKEKKEKEIEKGKPFFSPLSA
jgi:hypothetical protein